MTQKEKPRGVCVASGPRKKRASSPSLIDLESRWQCLVWHYESRGLRLPLRWRLFRRAVSWVLDLGSKGRI